MFKNISKIQRQIDLIDYTEQERLDHLRRKKNMNKNFTYGPEALEATKNIKKHLQRADFSNEFILSLALQYLLEGSKSHARHGSNSVNASIKVADMFSKSTPTILDIKENS